MLSLNKILTKFNELSSSSTMTFPLPFLHLLIHLHSSPPPTLPPCTSLAQFLILNPRLRLHLLPTTSPSKTTAIPERGPSIFFSETRVRGSAKATEDYYLSLPPHSTHVEGEDGQTERQRGPKASKRNNLRYQADTLDRKSRG